MYKRVMSLTTLPDLSSTPKGRADEASSTSTQRLEARMCQAVTSSDTLAAVDRLFKATPPNQHRMIALKVCE